MSDEPEVVWRGRFIEAKRLGKWEFVSRTGAVSAAVILAVDDGHVLLVEQYRVPIGARCLELPAGLVGDEEEGEEAAAAAIRELEEETGYRAERDGRPRPLLCLAGNVVRGLHPASRRGAEQGGRRAAESPARISRCTG